MRILGSLQDHAGIFFAMLLVIVAGIVGGFIGAAAVSVVAAILLGELQRLQFLLLLFVSMFILADNFEGPFAFAQNMRFVSLGLGIVVLAEYAFLQNQKAFWLLQFTIFALVVTYLYSPIGIPAILRAVGYFVVALCVFKLTDILLAVERESTVELLTVFLFLFFGINVLLYFIPVIGDLNVAGRFAGLMNNPNGLGLTAMFSYALVEWLRRREASRFESWFFIGFKLLLLFLIVVTGSRTAFLAVVAFELTNRFFEYKFLVVFGLIVIGVFSYFLSTAEAEMLIKSFGSNELVRVESIETASGRTEVWAVAWEEIKQHPWVGQGMMYDNYFINAYADQRFGENRARHWSGIWSSYLSLALNVGIIGLVLFGYFWYRLFRSAEDKIFRLAFLAMILLSAITESWMAASMNAFMPLVFIIWALQMQREDEGEEQDKEEEQRYGEAVG